MHYAAATVSCHSTVASARKTRGADRRHRCGCCLPVSLLRVAHSGGSKSAGIINRPWHFLTMHEDNLAMIALGA
jgi:hypothetical protein